MPPAPIQPHAVALVLQYIVPPSELDQPLPRHLLSRLLLSRHDFLGIPPTNPPEYLSWAPDGRHAAIAALERLPRPAEDAPPPAYPAQYEADDENAYAFVRIPDAGLRLTFLWDDEDGWTFHDVQLAAFPPTSTPRLDDALRRAAEPAPAPALAPDRAASHGFEAERRHSFGPAGSDHGDDGSYWDAYGAQDDDDDGPGRRSRGAHSAHSDGNEDAYWASYSSIQGEPRGSRPTRAQTQTLIADARYGRLDDPLAAPAAPPAADLRRARRRVRRRPARGAGRDTPRGVPRQAVRRRRAALAAHALVATLFPAR
jgi:hypothetical protein